MSEEQPHPQSLSRCIRIQDGEHAGFERLKDPLRIKYISKGSPIGDLHKPVRSKSKYEPIGLH